MCVYVCVFKDLWTAAQCVDCWGGVNELFLDLCHPTGTPQGDRQRQTGRNGDNKVAFCRWTSVISLYK